MMCRFFFCSGFCGFVFCIVVLCVVFGLVIVGYVVLFLLWFDFLVSFEVCVVVLVVQMILEEKVVQMQNVVFVIECFGVFVYDWWNEGFYGVVWVGQVIVFLQVIGLVVMFDVFLMGQVVIIISDEVCVKYYQFFWEGVYGCYQGLIFWLLNINIFCDL